MCAGQFPRPACRPRGPRGSPVLSPSLLACTPRGPASICWAESSRLPCWPRGPAFVQPLRHCFAMPPLLVGEASAYRKVSLFARGSPTRGNGDDRRQRRKQGGAVGAAASRMQATAKQTPGAATRPWRGAGDETERLYKDEPALCSRARPFTPYYASGVQ